GGGWKRWRGGLRHHGTVAPRGGEPQAGTAAASRATRAGIESPGAPCPMCYERCHGEIPVDLGIAGRKAIVCASSRGLGRACAEALAQAGCEVVINGLDASRLEMTAAELRQATGARVTAVAADVASAEGQAALFSSCPEPDILGNN